MIIEGQSEKLLLLTSKYQVLVLINLKPWTSNIVQQCFACEVLSIVLFSTHTCLFIFCDLEEGIYTEYKVVKQATIM